MTVTRTIAGHRQRERRRGPAPVMPQNAMRCSDCGTIWYSRLAELLITWAHCSRCNGQLHTERRQGNERGQYA